jgi:hypothetical protein
MRVGAHRADQLAVGLGRHQDGVGRAKHRGPDRRPPTWSDPGAAQLGADRDGNPGDPAGGQGRGSSHEVDGMRDVGAVGHRGNLLGERRPGGRVARPSRGRELQAVHRSDVRAGEQRSLERGGQGGWAGHLDLAPDQHVLSPDDHCPHRTSRCVG